MWRKLGRADELGLAAVLAVMHGVDIAYRHLGPDWLRLLMIQKNAEVFLFDAEPDRAVLILYPNPRLGRYRVYTTGYAGPLDPRTACLLLGDQLALLLDERGLDEVYAIRRLNLDNPGINQLLDHVPAHPLLETTVQHDMGDKWALRIRRRAPAPVAARRETVHAEG